MWGLHCLDPVLESVKRMECGVEPTPFVKVKRVLASTLNKNIVNLLTKSRTQAAHFFPLSKPFLYSFYILTVGIFILYCSNSSSVVFPLYFLFSKRLRPFISPTERHIVWELDNIPQQTNLSMRRGIYSEGIRRETVST